MMRILCWFTFIVVLLLEAYLILAVIPHGIREVHRHPLGELLRKDFINHAESISTIGIVCALGAVLSMAAFAFLANQAKAGRTGLILAAVVGLLGVWQLNVASAIQDVLKLEQPTGKMAVAALADLKLPALCIDAAIFLFALYLGARKKESQ